MKSFVESPFCISAIWPASGKFPPPPPHLATAEDLDRIVGVNLRGTFLCYKYAGLQMIAQGRGGRIIGLPPILLTHTRNSLRSATFSYRRVLWNRQTGTGIPKCLFCKQIRYPRVDSERRCV